jgi:solute:Na+ symporter, SSS family
MLITAITIYLVITVAIGLYAATRVSSGTDFALAGRSLPLVLIITMTFATWFGAETVLGVSAKFVSDGLGGVVSDPFGASLCLIFVGLFFAYRLYQMLLTTIGDFFRKRFGQSVEIFTSIAIMLSYLGWVAAQITALGLVFNVISAGAISPTMGMVLGAAIVLVYTFAGGMFAVAWTDFLQMIVIVVGLVAIAMVAGQLAGGVDKVVTLAETRKLFNFWPDGGLHAWLFFAAAAVTMMFGSIPQQDIFQRIMSAKDAKTAQMGPIIGGVLYLAFAFVPMFIAVAAVLIIPNAEALMKADAQKLLPTLVMDHMPMALKIAFFGALISAIMSTASATLLAPSTIFTENILRHIVGRRGDGTASLTTMRATLVAFSFIVLGYSLMKEGTPIHKMVAEAYTVTLIAAFVPLTAGLYWSRATTQGALLSIFLGIVLWLPVRFIPSWEAAFPHQFAGLIGACLGMIAGSLLPQWLTNRNEFETSATGSVHHPSRAAAN